MSYTQADVLLIEDNEDDAELTLLTLKESKYVRSVKVINDGSRALDYLLGEGEFEERDTSSQPALILLDIKMPKITGIEVLERIKKDERTNLIPVVILTSSREEPDIARCYALGVNSYIVKPVEYDKFQETIRQLGLYWKSLNIPPA